MIKRFLEKHQFKKMQEWVRANARPLELAKWDFLFNNGKKEKIVEEMLKYQNPDGGFGNALEPDLLLPGSSAIASGEAIFTAYKYGVDCSEKWFAKLLDYFVSTMQNTPSFWEFAPKEVENYPRPPWWGYGPDEKFAPNPCAIVASAMIVYGTEKHKAIGLKIAQKCFDFLLSEKHCGDHDSYCLIALVEKLKSVNSPLITDEIISSMKRRISENVCYDESQWSGYYPHPHQFADSPSSEWYDCVKDGIDKNLNYLLNNINEDGVWQPNFSWGVDSDTAREVTKIWTGYIAVDRARILKNYNMIMT